MRRQDGFPAVEKGIVSQENNKPVLDEQKLAKLLEAAYVLQEHNRELQDLELGLELKRDRIEARSVPQPSSTTEAAPQADYTLTLAQIVETQHQIQVRHLDLDNAMSLVANRVREIGRATGASIAIVKGDSVLYRAVAGSGTLPVSSEVPLDKALCVPCIRTGQVFRCPDINPEFLVDSEECRRRGIQSLIAVPVFHEGGIAGGVELCYGEPHAFGEQDVHTCQLMAGLVTEALVRDQELTWKKSLATERAVMLEALEKLKPNLAALVEPSAAKPESPKPSNASLTHVCRKCGNKLLGEEQFCGQCGSPRSGDHDSSSLQSKVASLWQMQEASREHPDTAGGESPSGKDEHTSEPVLAEALAASIEQQVPELFAADLEPEPSSRASRLSTNLRGAELDKVEPPPLGAAEAQPSACEEDSSETAALVQRPTPVDWSSASSARDFLEQLAGTKRSGTVARFWNSRRGDIYLAIAVILVVCVIRWGIWSSHPVTATGPANATAAAHHKSPDADLSLFDRMLISLGLAEAPEPPEDKGNPSTQVWVDQHTALYYCPGADLYGKTPTGKYMTQREAQLDQFEPAYRKACN